ncbi:hypothetical protein AB0H30_28200 [Streptomyces pseudogriseolus]|uniref:hypothetical protein n=1 Tax=Streptomyces pseudogriseolus TaxID=36817 RepID=UPI003499A0F8
MTRPIEDTTGARAAGTAAAQRLVAEHGAFLDDLEQQPCSTTPTTCSTPNSRWTEPRTKRSSPLSSRGRT